MTNNKFNTENFMNVEAQVYFKGSYFNINIKKLTTRVPEYRIFFGNTYNPVQYRMFTTTNVETLVEYLNMYNNRWGVENITHNERLIQDTGLDMYYQGMLREFNLNNDDLLRVTKCIARIQINYWKEGVDLGNYINELTYYTNQKFAQLMVENAQ